jgi:hypothetical protein
LRNAHAQVRDRATLYLAELGGKAGGAEAVDVHWDLPARNLEKSLRAYLDNGGEAPFSLVRLIGLPLRDARAPAAAPLLRERPGHHTSRKSHCRLLGRQDAGRAPTSPGDDAGPL